jgi:hypothetical protein
MNFIRGARENDFVLFGMQNLQDSVRLEGFSREVRLHLELPESLILYDICTQIYKRVT